MTAHYLLVSGDFVVTGGMDAALLGLARYLASRTRVECVTHRMTSDVGGAGHLAVTQVARPFGRHLLGAPLLAWSGWRRARALRRTGVRVVSNGGNCPATDVNWVHYVHAAYRPASNAGGTAALKSAMTGWLFRAAERAVIARSRVVVCNSALTADHVHHLLGVPRERLRVVYYGCDPTRLALITPEERASSRRALDAQSATRPWAVFIGAIGDARKGFDSLYFAWRALVRERQWDGVLWVVGRGIELRMWEQRARDDGLADSIRFLGFRNDVPAILAAADILVHPARYEAYGLGVHEALCRGLPAIVSRSAGIAERYPDELKDLLLDDPDSPDELANRLLTWRETIESWPERLRPFADDLRQRSWDDMAAEFVAAVEGTNA